MFHAWKPWVYCGVMSTTATAGPTQPECARPTSSRLGFNALEQRALTQLVDDPSGSMVSVSQERATALAGGDRDGVRLRALARAVALAEATHQQITVLLMAAVRTKEFETAKVLDKLLTGSNRRYCELMEQLCSESRGIRRQPVLFVAAASRTTSDRVWLMSDVETAVEGSPSPLPYPLKRAERHREVVDPARPTRSEEVSQPFSHHVGLRRSPRHSCN